MYCRMVVRGVSASLPGWRSLPLFLAHSPHRHQRRRLFFSSPFFPLDGIFVIQTIKERKFMTKAAKIIKHSNKNLDEKELTHILWWKEKLQDCRKPSSALLVQRLAFSNMLGIDSNLKNGSLKEGNLNWEMLQFKTRFPREVLLCRVGEFYEAVGFDACILVEYAGLNPFGGLRSESIPRAGCPVVNLRQTLDDLTRHGFSVMSTFG